MDFEKWIYFAIGFFSVFIGAAYHNAESRRNNGSALTDFQSFLFGTGFTYFLTVFWTQLTFFCDYFLPGSAVQGYARSPEKNVLFFALFGQGAAGERQYPIMNLDLCFLAVLAGCALGGAALLIRRAYRNRRFRTPEKGLFYGYTFPRANGAGFFKKELQTVRSQLAPAEYVCWWALRAGLVWAFVRHYGSCGFDNVSLQLAVNLLATFIIPIARVLCFWKLFFGKINYRVQSLIDIFIFAGSFLGQGLELNGTVPEYDKILHFVSGGVAVFVGCKLIEGTRGAEKISKYSKTVASMGFSCVVMVVWELFEFFADHYMTNSFNQNYEYNPPADLFFFRWFGFGACNPGQYAVLDTDLDIFLALGGCVLCGAALFAVLSAREKSPSARIVKKAPTQSAA